MTISEDDLLQMDGDDLFAVMKRGNPLDVDAMSDTTYTGVDLSMPALFHKLMWKSFRKTFHRDPVTGVLRGWNVRVEQTGWDTPPPAMTNKRGAPITFGHYEVREAAGVAFPRDWEGGHYLDYRVAGNKFFDTPARLGACPLVSVNEGDSSLLLGWEVFKAGPLTVSIKDFWLLKLEGQLAPDDVVPRPVAH